MIEFENIYPKKISSNLKIKKEWKLTKEEEKIISMNIEYIKKNSWYWDIKDTNYSFNLPPTVFVEHFEISDDTLINYEDGKSVKYKNPQDEMRKPLREEHLREIWRKGEFSVPSTIENLPYKWKLSLWTVKGIDNIKESYINDLAKSFYFVYKIKDRFVLEYYEHFFASFPSSFYSIYQFFFYTIDLFIGLPAFIDNKEEIITKVKHDNLISFIEAHPSIKLKMFLYTNYSDILALEDKFLREWDREILKKKNEYGKLKMEQNEISLKIRNESIEAFKAFLENSPRYQEFNELYDTNSFLAVQQILFNHELQYTHLIKEYEEKLKQCYIRSKISEWYENKMSNYKDEVQKRIRNDFFSQVERETKQYTIPSSILVGYYDFQGHFEEKVKNERKTFPKRPEHVYEIRRICTRPYKVNVDSKTNSYWLKKHETYQIGSSFPFWRIGVFFVKYYVYFFNIAVSLLWFMTYSSVGLLSLFCVEVYQDEDINTNTGVVTQVDQSYTFPRAIRNLCTWISSSRKKFEDSPDTGIFSKSFARIFNLFYNYIIKCFLFGILLITLYPIVIILCVSVSLCLVISSPILSLIVVVFQWLANIFIVDWIEENSPSCPLFRYIFWNLITKGIMQLMIIIPIIVFQLILSLFIFLFAQLRFVLRVVYDFLMYYIVKCLGKIPVIDTCLAWKKAGPELFREHFFDISDQDIITLLRGFLEEKKLSEYERISKNYLNVPQHNMNNNISRIFKLIDLNYQPKQKIIDSIDFFQSQLDKQISDRRSLYPTLRNYTVKFSQKRLEFVKNLVGKYINEYSMDTNIDEIVKSYRIENKENLTEVLVEKILVDIFGQQILETLEDNDQIVHLESKTNNNLDNTAKKIFEDPNYTEMVLIEDEPIKLIQEEIKEWPKLAHLKDIFKINSELFLDLSYLNQTELENYVGVDSLKN